MPQIVTFFTAEMGTPSWILRRSFIKAKLPGQEKVFWKDNCCREQGSMKLHLLGDLSSRPVLIKPGHRREVLLQLRRWTRCTSEIPRIPYLGDGRRVVRADQSVGVGWVANNLDKCKGDTLLEHLVRWCSRNLRESCRSSWQTGRVLGPTL